MTRAFISVSSPMLPGNFGVNTRTYGEYKYVTAFLAYCELCGYPSPEKSRYGLARLVQVISNFYEDLDGVSVCQYRDSMPFSKYYECSNWRVLRIPEDESDDLSELNDIMQDINRHMPSHQQLSELVVADQALRVYKLLNKREI